jgi:hypothetical protein
VRLSDTNNDGVSDTRDTLATVPSGKVSAVRRGGDLLFITGQGVRATDHDLARRCERHNRTDSARR